MIQYASLHLPSAVGSLPFHTKENDMDETLRKLRQTIKFLSQAQVRFDRNWGEYKEEGNLLSLQFAISDAKWTMVEKLAILGKTSDHYDDLELWAITWLFAN